MGKGSSPRPLQINQQEYGRRFERTFPKKAPRSLQERERADANNYAEHGRRLRRSLKLHAPLDGTKFPDQTVTE
jgi:hypothetical protein